MRRVLGVLVLVLIGGAGCLEVPSGPGQECAVASDCDAGEVCHQGLCYGNPPTGTFAATLSAPSTREELVATEIADLRLTPDGNLGELQLETPVTISGRVEAFCPNTALCSTMSIAAEVRLIRPSRFPGGPALRFSVQSTPDIPRGTDSFTIRVPRTRDGDPPYVVTIDPLGGGDMPPADGSTAPAELVPPLRLTLSATENLEHQTYTLGHAEDRIITGTLRDAFMQPLVGYRVVALGRWDATGPLTEVSTVDFSSDGTYSISVTRDALEPLELVARPYGSSDVAAELHVGNVGAYSQQRNLVQPLGTGGRKDVELSVEGLVSTGGVQPISGARVIVSGSVEPSYAGGTRAVFTTEATTGEDGVVRLSLLDGAALASSYRLRVVPPASSNLGILYDRALDLQEIVPLRLPSRIALAGTLVDVAGTPLAGVSVTARRSLRFLWSLTAPDQTFLDEIPAPTAITPESGEFVVWVDPAVADVWGHYDLFFDAPAGSVTPDWAMPDLEIPRVPGQESMALGMVTIPDASRVRATIVDAEGYPVEGSALRIFQQTSNDPVCTQVSFEPMECLPAWLPVGSAESDGRGQLQLTLPRP